MPGEPLWGSSAVGPVILWCPASLMDGPAILSQRMELIQGDHRCNLPSPHSSHALWVVEGPCIVCGLPSAASQHRAPYHNFLQPGPLQEGLTVRVLSGGLRSNRRSLSWMLEAWAC